MGDGAQMRRHGDDRHVKAIVTQRADAETQVSQYACENIAVYYNTSSTLLYVQIIQAIPSNQPDITPPKLSYAVTPDNVLHNGKIQWKRNKQIVAATTR